MKIKLHNFAENKYMLKVNNKNTRKNFEMCWKSIIKTPERRIVNFEHISHLFCSGSIVVFEFWIWRVMTSESFWLEGISSESFCYG